MSMPRRLLVFAMGAFLACAGGARAWDRVIAALTPIDSPARLVADPAGGWWLGSNTFQYGIEGGQWIVHLSDAGVVEWARLYGDDNTSALDTSFSGSGGSLVTGGNVSYPETSPASAYVLRLTPAGDVAWHVRFPVGWSHSVSVIASDGGAVAQLGSRLVRLGPDGTAAWCSSVPAGSDRRLAVSADNRVLAAYGTSSGGRPAVGLLFLDASGTLLANVLLSHPGLDLRMAAAEPSSSGGWLVTIWTQPAPGASGVAIVELGPDGRVVREGALDRGVSGGRAAALRPLPGGGAALVARGDVGGQEDALVMKLDAAWNVEWQRAFGGYATDGATDILATTTGYIVAARTTVPPASEGSPWIFTLDMQGRIEDSCATSTDTAFGLSASGIVATAGTATVAPCSATPTPAPLMTRLTVWDDGHLGADAYENGDACGRGAFLNESASQSRDFCGDAEDWATLAAIRGQAYTMTTANLGPSADTVVEVLAPDCTTVLASDDDGGGGTASRLSWVAPATGSYPVRVRSSDGTTGAGRQHDLAVSGPTLPADRWSRFYETGDRTWIYSIVPFAAGYLAVGENHEDLFGGRTIAIALSSDGAPVWAVDGTGGLTSCPTPDGGAVVGGDGRLVRFDRSGAIRWQLGVAVGTPGIAHVSPMREGGFLVTGVVSSSLFALAIGDDGALRWATRLGSSGFQWAFRGLELADGSILAAGDIGGGPNGSSDVLLAHLDSAGRPLATMALGTSYGEELAGVAELADGTLMIAGRIGNSGVMDTSHRVWAARVAWDGTVLWSRRYDGWGYFELFAAEGGAPCSGEMVLAGTGDVTGAVEGVVFGVEDDGDVAWQVAVDGRQKSDHIFGLRLLPDRGLLLTGRVAASWNENTESGWIVRMGEQGDLGACRRTMPGNLVSVPIAATMLPVLLPEGLPPTVTAAAWPLDPVAVDVLDSCVGAADVGLPARPPEVSGAASGRPLVFESKTRMSWEPRADVMSYNVYRGDLGDRATFGAGACWLQTCSSWADVPASPGPGNGWFFVVDGESVRGEGTLGTTSRGSERMPSIRCP